MTIKEIAELVGTSRGTVDRVLNERGNVRKELADKIRKTAAEHDYHPNPLARALVRSQKHFVIGVIINSLGNPFFQDVLTGLRERSSYYRDRGLQVLIREIGGYDQSEQRSAIQEMLAQNVDGLAITPLNHPAVGRALNALTIPLITLNTDIIGVSRLAFVGCDYKNSGRLAGDIAGLMLQEGKIGVIIGDRYMLGHVHRVEGFEDSIRRAKGLRIVEIAENSDNDERSYEVTRLLLDLHHPDLLYFAAAGIDGGMRAVMELAPGCRVITVDETAFTRECLRHGLIAATITQQPEEQGRRTVDILYNYLMEKERPPSVHCYTENQVKLRNSN